MNRKVYRYPLIIQAILTTIALILFCFRVINSEVCWAIMFVSFVASAASEIVLFFKVENNVQS